MTNKLIINLKIGKMNLRPHIRPLNERFIFLVILLSRSFKFEGGHLSKIEKFLKYCHLESC